MNSRTTLMAVISTILLLAGCAATPAEVLATSPSRAIPVRSAAAPAINCILARLDEMSGSWSVSSRTTDSGTRILIHGGVDAGTLAVISLSGDASAGTATIHLSPNVITRDYFTDKVAAEIAKCN